MAELKKELIVKLDHKEITNIECIKMHGQEMVDTYKSGVKSLALTRAMKKGRSSSSMNGGMVMILMKCHKRCGIFYKRKDRSNKRSRRKNFCPKVVMVIKIKMPY